MENKFIFTISRNSLCFCNCCPTLYLLVVSSNEISGVLAQKCSRAYKLTISNDIGFINQLFRSAFVLK